MRTVTATEAKQRFAAMLDAAQRGPVEIRRQDRPSVVLMSAEEYDRLRGLAVSDFQRFCDRVGEKAKARGLTEKKLAAILASDD
ncbi:MAG: type II toxin-antitoxin system Phd/YefM family antitoxin [Burkholderiales bacterium]